MDEKKFEGQLAEIMAKIPANPFITDLVARAFQIFIKYNSMGDLIDTPEYFIKSRLSTVSKVASFVTSISNPAFYKYHLIMASILAGVPENEYDFLDSPAKNITKVTTALTELLNAEGCKDKWNALFNIGKDDSELLAIALMFLTDEVEMIKGDEAPNVPLIMDGYLEVCLRKSSIPITNEIYPYYNAFIAAINKTSF